MTYCYLLANLRLRFQWHSCLDVQQPCMARDLASVGESTSIHAASGVQAVAATVLAVRARARVGRRQAGGMCSWDVRATYHLRLCTRFLLVVD